MSSKAKFVITALALAAAAAANATSFSSATLGPIQVQLFDLNPLDGVGPSITFLPSGYGSNNYATASAYDYYLGNNSNESNYGSNGFSSVSANASIPTALSTASITSGSDESAAQGTSLSASGQASGAPGNYYYSGSNYNANASAPGYSGGFVLSAYTMVSFSALATTSATTTVGNDSILGGYENAQANASLSISGSAPLGIGYQSSGASIFSYASYTYSALWDDQAQQYIYTYSGQQSSSFEMLGVSFTNLTAADMQGNFNASVGAYGYSSIAAVPEPETYAMLLAGMGVIATIARRRRA